MDEGAEVPWMFDWVEYITFVLVLVISALVGIYFGCIKGGQNTLAGYLLGGRQMSVIPITVSLVTAYISGITLIGVPAEVYMFGIQYAAACINMLVIGPITVFMIIPVFFKLQLLSPYEYMEMRFGQSVRLVLSAIFIIHQFGTMTVVNYGPALTINQVTGLNEKWASTIVTAICIFYTTLGGLKAVVWTDTIQGVLMIISLMTVVVMGTIRMGGFQQVISTAIEGDRLQFFDFDPDPTKRLTFWSTFGITLLWMSSCTFSPESIQRYTALPTIRDARTAASILPLGAMVFTILCGYVGVLTYAAFKDCDPITSGLISRPDQIVPLFILKVCGDVRGLAGLFTAGVVSAALSSLSAAMNTVAAIIYKDFLSHAFNEPSEMRATFIIKSVVLALGVACILSISVINKLGNATVIVSAMGGVTLGPILGIYVLGLLLPWATNKGALYGGLTSFLCMGWLSVATTIYKLSGALTHPTKVVNTDGCLHNFTKKMPPKFPDTSAELPYLYRISVFFYVMIGMIITVTVGMLVSYLTGFNKLEDVNPDLIAPLVHSLLPKKPAGYDAVTQEIEMTEPDGCRNWPICEEYQHTRGQVSIEGKTTFLGRNKIINNVPT